MSRVPSIPRPRLLLPALLVFATGCFLDRSPQSGPTDSTDGGGNRDAQVVRPDAGPAPDAGRPLDAGPGPDGGAPISDRDGDGIPDDIDVCPDVYDPYQLDLDGDGVGDACDDDRDGDGIPNELDLCPDRYSLGVPDEDGDGIMDECDVCPLDPDPEQLNADLDQLGDACEDPNPARFSRVAYLATFTLPGEDLSPGGDLVADPMTGVTVMGGSAHIAAPGRTILWLPAGTRFTDNYAVDVRATYRQRQGNALGTVGALTRWSSPPGAGYALGMQTSTGSYGMLRLCPGPCPETLVAHSGLGVGRDTPIAIRTTAVEDSLALALRVADQPHVREATATNALHAAGGIGVLVEGAQVEVHAIAVYAP